MACARPSGSVSAQSQTQQATPRYRVVCADTVVAIRASIQRNHKPVGVADRAKHVFWGGGVEGASVRHGVGVECGCGCMIMPVGAFGSGHTLHAEQAWAHHRLL
jgi:hypothetical protein